MSSENEKNSPLNEGLITLGMDYVYAFRLVKILYQDWDKTQAFKLGVIDANGTKLKDPETLDEKSSYSPFIRLAFNVKRLISHVPGGKFTSLAAAYMLMKESSHEDQDKVMSEVDMKFLEFLAQQEELDESRGHKILATKLSQIEARNSEKVSPHQLEITLKSGNKLKAEIKVTGSDYYIVKDQHDKQYRTDKEGNVLEDYQEQSEPTLVEDAPVNSGAGAGIPADTANASGGPVVRRNWKDMDKFAGSHVFEVDGSCFDKCKSAKQRYERWDKYISEDDGETGQDIIKFAKTYPKRGVILKDKTTGAMVHLKNPFKE